MRTKTPMIVIARGVVEKYKTQRGTTSVLIAYSPLGDRNLCLFCTYHSRVAYTLEERDQTSLSMLGNKETAAFCLL